LHTSQVFAVRHKTNSTSQFQKNCSEERKVIPRSFTSNGHIKRTCSLGLRESRSPSSLQTQLQLVKDPSEPAVIEVVNKALRAYASAPGSEPHLTNPADVQDAIRALKVGKTPRPNLIQNRALKHLPLSVVFLLVGLFKAIFQIQYFPQVGKTPACFPY
jgi:hypothetical protein